MALNEKVANAIARTKSWEDLITLERNIQNQGMLSDEAKSAINTKATAFGREHLIQRAALDSGILTDAESRVLDVIGEYWALQKRAGKPISRTLLQISNRGLLEAAEASVCRNKPSLGYQNLNDAGLDALSYEQIVIDFPDEFSSRATWFARRTLGLPNATEKPPASSDAEIHAKTAVLVDWLKDRVDPSSGQIAPFANEEAASSLGMQDLQRYGRAYGNIQSRIDFACFRAGLPPLGLASIAPFPKAWSATGCDWDFPISSMQLAAQSHIWSEEDFRRIHLEGESLPGLAWVVWQEAITINEEGVRDWAFGLAENVNQAKLADGADWSDEELEASVGAYFEMLTLNRSGIPFVKKRYYEELAARFARTPKAFEYRMQNISYVMSLLGRRWLPGLKPASNVGSKIGEKIEALIAEIEGRVPQASAIFAISVNEQRKVLRKTPIRPVGTRSPSSARVSVTRYARDLAVMAWILEQADGVCECCQQPAPFKTEDGPFLEVHHVRHLADKGSDTISNTVALCPNCHRRLHYSIDAEAVIEDLYRRVSRLVREDTNSNQSPTPTAAG